MKASHLTSYGFTVVLVGACIAFGGLLAFEMLIRTRPDVGPNIVPASLAQAPDMGSPPTAATTPRNSRGKDSFAAVGERPLFHPSRRAPPAIVSIEPKPSPAPAVSATASPIKPYILLGIAVDRNRRVALVGLPGGSPTIRLAIGDEVDGWKVAAIRADHVLLRSGDREHRIAFSKLRDQVPGAGASSPLPTGRAPRPGPQQ